MYLFNKVRICAMCWLTFELPVWKMAPFVVIALLSFHDHYWDHY